ncbi:MAG TPA: ATP-binding protein, partial [Thermoplasmata archaeon]|nr:ATP-binding protein [Thermoplasmata archaeon]
MAVKVTPDRGTNGKPPALPPPESDIYSDLYEDDIDDDDLGLELARPRKAMSNGTGPKTFIGLLGGKKAPKPPTPPPARGPARKPRPGPPAPKGTPKRPGALPSGPASKPAGDALKAEPTGSPATRPAKSRLGLFGRAPIPDDEPSPEETGFFRKHGQYYIINLIVVVVFGFFATLMLMLFVFAFSGISAELPDFAAHMIPNHGGDQYLALAAGTVACFAAFVLHYADRKRNLMLGTAVAGVILGGLGLQIVFPNPGLSLSVIVIFGIVAFVFVLDLKVLLMGPYPRILEDHSRSELPDVISRSEQLQKSLRELEDRLMEEEERLKTREQEIAQLKANAIARETEIAEEEENLKQRINDLQRQKSQLSKSEEEVSDEEEKLRVKRNELENLRVEGASEEFVREEEERLKSRSDQMLDEKLRLERESKSLQKEEAEAMKRNAEIETRRKAHQATTEDLAEEEEMLKRRETAFTGIKQQYESQELVEEERLSGLQDKVRDLEKRFEQMTEMAVEDETEFMKKKGQKLEDVLRDLDRKYQEISSKEAEIDQMKEKWRSEEEEKIKNKEEELFRLRNETDVKSKLADDLRGQMRSKERELQVLKAELDKTARKKMETEEEKMLRKLASEERGKRKAKRTLYPFTAIVGQERMKKTLVLNAINPGIGGTLVKGQKGTAKSVSVRGLAEILPEIEVAEGCRFNCDPKEKEQLCEDCKAMVEAGDYQVGPRPIRVVDLPLNVTEDRLVGAIDIEKILKEGKKAFEPGILAECHRGILYVDEINLLDDYIVDLLLDAAAGGRVAVEREGISISYPSRFVIVGSMNPEEGELRPQLLDRLALQAEVVGIQDVGQRVEIVKRREEFTAAPEDLRRKFDPLQQELMEQIRRARELVPRVRTPERVLKIIARMCIDFDVAGHRADTIIERTARTNASLMGRTDTALEDVAEAAILALPHRMR